LQFCSWFGVVQVPHVPTWWWLSRVIWSRTILRYANSKYLFGPWHLKYNRSNNYWIKDRSRIQKEQGEDTESPLTLEPYITTET
jgi:hypothetical protein